MKKSNPSLRFLVNLCDPIDRTYSHIIHYLKNKESSLYGASPNDLMENFTIFLTSKNQGSKNSLPGVALYSMLEQYANFSTTLQPYFQTFWRKRFHFIDGQALLENPEWEFRLIEKFFELKPELNFEFNKTKGFPCLKEPVPFCLGKNKGRTRGSLKSLNRKIDDAIIEKLSGHFSNEMKKTFHVVHPGKHMKHFCASPLSYRFSWLAKYVC